MSNHSVLHASGDPATLRDIIAGRFARPLSAREAEGLLPNVAGKARDRGPSHYNQGQIQPWDFIADHNLSYDVGTAVAYLTRAGKKKESDFVTDLSKAIHHLQHAIDVYQETIQQPELADGPRVSREVSGDRFPRPCYEDYAERFDC